MTQSEKERLAALPPYTGVPSGPYKRHYDAWLKSPEGQRVTKAGRPRTGYLDVMLALHTTGLTKAEIDEAFK